MQRVFFFYTLTALFFISQNLFAQNFDAVSRCGGIISLEIPEFTDNDADGLSDELEEILLRNFVPKFVEYIDDDCPGPSTGTSNPSDSNLVVCHIFPVFSQYVNGTSAPILYSEPIAMVSENCLSTGLGWFDNSVLIYGALLYGRDCGLTSHVADVEGFAVSIKYIGADDGISWRSDTVIANWQGMKIQTVSHSGTFCEAIETFPFRSNANPNGKDTIYPSPDKHGNYLTPERCSSNFICDPACDDPFIMKKIKIVNVGEENAPLVTDLGLFYSGYAGENPWGNVNFLNGGAGTIKSKMLRTWRNDFIQAQTLNSCTDICAAYSTCRNCGTDVYNACIESCAGIPNNQTGCNSPAYNCTVGFEQNEKNELRIFPNPANNELHIIFDEKITAVNIFLSDASGRILKKTIHAESKEKIDVSDIAKGIYFLKIENNKFVRFNKQLIIQ